MWKSKAYETDILSPKQKAKDENGKPKKIIKEIKDEECVSFGGKTFELKKIKGKKTALLPYENFIKATKSETDENLVKQVGGLCCKILFENGYTLLDGEKLELALKLAKSISLSPMPENKFDKKLNISLADEGASARLSDALDIVLGVAVAKQKSKEYGFVCLFTDGNGTYWFKVSRGFTTALNESSLDRKSVV